MRDDRDDLVPGAPSPEEETGHEESSDPIEELYNVSCSIHVFNRDRRVHITFEPKPDLLVLEPAQAFKFGREIMERAKRAMKGGGGRVPRA